MRAAIAIALAISGGVADAKPAAKKPAAPTTVTFAGGHIKMTLPDGWGVAQPDGNAEGMGKGSTSLMVFVLPGSPDAMMDLAEAAEADTVTYTGRGHGMLGGLHVLAAPGKMKTGKGGRGVYTAATCLGTVVITEQWDGDAPDPGLTVAIKSLAYDPEAGSMYLYGTGGADKLAPDAKIVAERAASSVCLGATTWFVDDAADAVDVDGTTMDRKAIADAITKAGDLATWLRMTAGMWQVQRDPDDANHFVVARIPTKAQGEAEQETMLLYELHAGAWKLTKVRRASQ